MRFINLIKKSIDYVPHVASILAQCKVLTLDIGAYISVGIDRGKDKSIYSRIRKLNASMGVQDSSSLSQGKEYCFFTPQLFDDNGNIVYEESKFGQCQNLKLVRSLSLTVSSKTVMICHYFSYFSLHNREYNSNDPKTCSQGVSQEHHTDVLSSNWVKI